MFIPTTHEAAFPASTRRRGTLARALLWLLAGAVPGTAILRAQVGPPTQLTFNPPGFGVNSPAWSPDGQWIAFLKLWGLIQVWKVDHTGSVLQPLDAPWPCWQNSLAWSSDGQFVYFLQDNCVQPTFQGQGFPARLPGGGGTTVALGRRGAWEFSLSRNGMNIGYWWANLWQGGDWGVGLLRLTTGADHALLSPRTVAYYGALAPTGTAISYWDHATQSLRVYSVTGLQTMFQVPGCVVYPAWSPAGDRIALTGSNCFSSPVMVLRWIRPFDPTVHSLGDQRVNSFPFWSPSGNYIAVGTQGSPEGDIVVVHVPSGQRTVVCRSCWAGRWPVIAWSPFSDELAYCKMNQQQTIVNLFKAPTGVPLTPAVVGTLVPGTRNTIEVRSAADAGRSCQIAASFGSEPGIRTGRGVIPLNPDPLFWASVQAAPGFYGFSGWLDASGRMNAFMDLPNLPDTVGTRFFVGYVVFEATGGLGTISDSVPLFVQPLQ